MLNSLLIFVGISKEEFGKELLSILQKEDEKPDGVDGFCINLAENIRQIKDFKARLRVQTKVLVYLNELIAEELP